MCLSSITDQRKKHILAALPTTFPCWKVIQTNGYCEYDYEKQEPKLSRCTHVATKGLSNHRTGLRRGVKYGYHAYLTRPDLPIQSRYDERHFKVVKCWASKTDIVDMGYNQAAHGNIIAISVSKITRK